MRLFGERNSEPLAHNTQQPWPEMKACLVIQWLVVAEKGLARTECNMRLLGERNSEPLAHNTQE